MLHECFIYFCQSYIQNALSLLETVSFFLFVKLARSGSSLSSHLANARCLLICQSYIQNALTFLELVLLVFLKD